VSTSPGFLPHRQPDRPERLVEAGSDCARAGERRARGAGPPARWSPGRSRPDVAVPVLRWPGGVATWGGGPRAARRTARPRPAGWRFPAEHPPSPRAAGHRAGGTGAGARSAQCRERRRLPARAGSSRVLGAKCRRCSSPSARSPAPRSACRPPSRRSPLPPHRAGRSGRADHDRLREAITRPLRLSTGPGQSTVQEHPGPRSSSCTARRGLHERLRRE